MTLPVRPRAGDGRRKMMISSVPVTVEPLGDICTSKQPFHKVVNIPGRFVWYHELYILIVYWYIYTSYDALLKDTPGLLVL